MSLKRGEREGEKNERKEEKENWKPTVLVDIVSSCGITFTDLKIYVKFLTFHKSHSKNSLVASTSPFTVKKKLFVNIAHHLIQFFCIVPHIGKKKKKKIEFVSGQSLHLLRH